MFCAEKVGPVIPFYYHRTRDLKSASLFLKRSDILRKAIGKERALIESPIGDEIALQANNGSIFLNLVMYRAYNSKSDGN